MAIVLFAVGTDVAGAQSSPAPQSGPALAVLPFTNVTGDPADNWISEGIAEAATSDLGTLAGIMVIGRETILDALQASGNGPEARIDDAAALSLGRLVGATWLVSGSFQRAGGVIRVTARVVDVATGSVVEAAKVDGEASDVFGLQDQLGRALRTGIEATLLARAASAPTGAPPRLEEPPRIVAVTPESSTPFVDRPVEPEAPAPPASTVAPPAVSAPPPPNTQSASTVLATPGGLIDGPPVPVAPEIITRDETGRATMRAVRITEEFVVDGQLNEAFYGTIPAVSDFIQQDPDEGAPATEKTEAWIVFDDENIYVAGRCWDSQPERMIVNEMRRDGPVMQNENFAVIFDTFYDRRNGFIFHANPIGGMFDGDVRPTLNRDWNGVWDVKTGRFDGGWTIEMVIPFKTLRYRTGSSQVWGVNLRRIVRWKNELSYLVPVPSTFGLGGIAQPSRAATLVGLEVPGASSNIEIKPYAITDLTSNI
ncbi:MAG: hypothetical protein AB7P22_04275, partial [Vicinamibacterales bacterium]